MDPLIVNRSIVEILWNSAWLTDQDTVLLEWNGHRKTSSRNADSVTWTSSRATTHSLSHAQAMAKEGNEFWIVMWDRFMYGAERELRPAPPSPVQKYHDIPSMWIVWLASI